MERLRLQLMITMKMPIYFISICFLGGFPNITFAEVEYSSEVDSFIKINFINKSITNVDSDSHLTSINTEARWMFLLDQISNPLIKNRNFESYKDCVNFFSAKHEDFNPKTMHLYYSELNKSFTNKDKRIVVMNCYFYVDKKTGIIKGFMAGNINSYHLKYDFK